MEQKIFVVSPKQDGSMRLHPLGQSVEHRARRRSPVDVVADEYLDNSVRCRGLTIRVYARKNPFEQIQTAVHVANRIDPRSFFKARALPVTFPLQRFPHELKLASYWWAKKRVGARINNRF